MYPPPAVDQWLQTFNPPVPAPSATCKCCQKEKYYEFVCNECTLKRSRALLHFQTSLFPWIQWLVGLAADATKVMKARDIKCMLPGPFTWTMLSMLQVYLRSLPGDARGRTFTQEKGRQGGSKVQWALDLVCPDACGAFLHGGFLTDDCESTMRWIDAKQGFVYVAPPLRLVWDHKRHQQGRARLTLEASLVTWASSGQYYWPDETWLEDHSKQAQKLVKRSMRDAAGRFSRRRQITLPAAIRAKVTDHRPLALRT